jgi:hypothetical protein
MTPTEKRELAEWLAVNVCGWIQVKDYWRGDKILVPTSDFDPIDDPRDCAIVMEAWRAKRGSLHIGVRSSEPWWATAYGVDARDAAHGVANSESEAICLAIARASGWKGGE